MSATRPWSRDPYPTNQPLSEHTHTCVGTRGRRASRDASHEPPFASPGAASRSGQPSDQLNQLVALRLALILRPSVTSAIGTSSNEPARVVHQSDFQPARARRGPRGCNAAAQVRSGSTGELAWCALSGETPRAASAGVRLAEIASSSWSRIRLGFCGVLAPARNPFRLAPRGCRRPSGHLRR